MVGEMNEDKEHDRRGRCSYSLSGKPLSSASFIATGVSTQEWQATNILLYEQQTLKSPIANLGSCLTCANDVITPKPLDKFFCTSVSENKKSTNHVKIFHKLQGLSGLYSPPSRSYLPPFKVFSFMKTDRDPSVYY